MNEGAHSEESEEAKAHPPESPRAGSTRGEVAPSPAEGPDSAREERELEELRSLLLGEEKREIARLRQRLEERALDAEEVAAVLPDAVLLQGARGEGFAKALSPTIDSAIQESVKNDPTAIADAIFPVIGPAIRKAIRQALAQTIESLNTTMEHSFSPKGLGWRLEAWRTGRPFAEVVLAHSLVWRVEQVFLIHGETGVVLEEVGVAGGIGGDPDLVAGMLTAIQDFCADSFQTEGRRPLHEIGFEEFRVLVASGPRAAIAAVIRGRVPAEYKERLDRAIEGVHARLAADLEAFDGNTAKFIMARPIMEECLGQEAREKKRGVGSALPALIALVAVFSAAIYASRVLLAHRNETRTARSAFEKLDQAPGIFVGSYRRAEGDEEGAWVLDGLKDPDAVDPREILSSEGLGPETVTMHWEAIRSFEPEILARRAERILDVPLGVRLSVEGGRLVARGVVSSAWLQAARGRLDLVDGVTEIQIAPESSVVD